MGGGGGGAYLYFKNIEILNTLIIPFLTGNINACNRV